MIFSRSWILYSGSKYLDKKAVSLWSGPQSSYTISAVSCPLQSGISRYFSCTQTAFLTLLLQLSLLKCGRPRIWRNSKTWVMNSERTRAKSYVFKGHTYNSPAAPTLMSWAIGFSGRLPKQVSVSCGGSAFSARGGKPRVCRAAAAAAVIT